MILWDLDCNIKMSLRAVGNCDEHFAQFFDFFNRLKNYQLIVKIAPSLNHSRPKSNIERHLFNSAA